MTGVQTCALPICIFAFIFLGATSVAAQDEEVVFEESKKTTKFQRSYFPPRDAGWWTLGINGGWAYQSSDVPTTYQGYGFGMTLAKNLYYQPGSPISFDARGRWLYSQSIGLDTKRATGLENNDALNGSREAGEGLDYTDPLGPNYIPSEGTGYVFQNNKELYFLYSFYCYFFWFCIFYRLHFKAEASVAVHSITEYGKSL